MKRLFIVLLVLLSLACAFSAVNAGSCIVDDLGCKIIDEDGNEVYLMFWSEAARKYIMGDLTAPGTGVIDLSPDIKPGMMMSNDSEPEVAESCSLSALKSAFPNKEDVCYTCLHKILNKYNQPCSAYNTYFASCSSSCQGGE